MDGFDIFGVIITIVVILIVILGFGYSLFVGIYSRTVGNKTPIDLQYKFDKAYVYLNNDIIELDIDTWSDYEGEQIQVITKDGDIYLLSSFYTILKGERK